MFYKKIKNTKLNDIEKVSIKRQILEYCQNVVNKKFSDAKLENIISLIDEIYKNKDIIKWNPCNYKTGEGMPETAGSYFVCRKDGKIHKENYNGTGWAYNGNSIVYWVEIKSPI